MNSQLAMVLTLLAAAVVMFALDRPRMDAVALLMMALLPLTGVLTMTETLSGFSDPNVVLIAFLFVVGEGLVRSGVAQRLGDWLVFRTGHQPVRLLVLLMIAVALLGAVMSSTGVVAIFIPVVLRIAQSTGLAPGQLMMPLSVAALISGMMTLVGTAPNLVVNAELVRSGAPGFSFFSFTPFGAAILVVGIGYLLFARRWLPSGPRDAAPPSLRPSLQDWVRRYGLAEREHRLRVTPGSPLVGRTVRDVDLQSEAGVNIVAIERRHRLAREVIEASSRETLQADDVLFVDISGPPASAESWRREHELEVLPLGGAYFTDRSQEIGMAEVLVSENSGLAGRTPEQTRFRTRFGLTVIGLRRREAAVPGRLAAEPMRAGDVLLVIGTWRDISRLDQFADDLLVLSLPRELDEVLPAAGRAPQAAACLLLMIGLMVSGLVPNVQAALIACLLLGALRCVDLDSAYRSVHWKSLVLIVGMLPFSLALQRTGGIELAAQAMMAVAGGAGNTVLLASLFLATATLGLFISNTATAVLMAPVAIAIARDLKASPLPFAMIVALAASTAFMTPVSSPVNTLVMGPGNYRFSDFVKLGVPLAVLVMVVSVLLVPWLLPIHP